MCFYAESEDDPRGSKHVALMNTKSLVVLTVLTYVETFSIHLQTVYVEPAQREICVSIHDTFCSNGIWLIYYTETRITTAYESDRPQRGSWVWCMT
jgi:hypothetical protein